MSLDTERLLLKPRTLADLDACLAMDQDPEVTQYIPGPWDGSAEHIAFTRSRITLQVPEHCGYWSVFAKANPEQFLGWLSFIPRDGVGPELELGWRLNRASWGQGYATEAAHSVATHAFETAGAQRLVADIHVHNAASMRVAEKLGFRALHDEDFEGMPYRVFELTRETYLDLARRDTRR